MDQKCMGPQALLQNEIREQDSEFWKTSCKRWKGTNEHSREGKKKTT